MRSIYSLRRNIGFDVLWNEVKDCFRSLVLKVIALRCNNEWKNVLITGLLTYSSPEDLRKEVKDEYDNIVKLGITSIENLLVAYDILDAADLPRVINELETGKITISNQVIRLRDPRGGIRLENSIRFVYRDLLEYSGISVEVYSGGSPTSIKEFNNIEEELKSFGYASFDELCVQWLGMPCNGYTLEASIAIPIYLANTRLEYDSKDGSLIFSSKVHKSLLSKLRIVVTLAEKRNDMFIPVENIVKGFDELERQQTSLPDFVLVNLRFKFRKDLKRDDIIRYRILSNLGILEKKELSLSELLPELHDLQRLFTVFLDLDTLLKIIRGEENLGGIIGKRTELAFQRAIAWLFTLLGFRVVELEGTRFKTFKEVDKSEREVDMLLYDENTGIMYIVDCSIRAPEPKKIDDIANAKLSLLRRNVLVEPLIIVREYAQESKRNARRVRVLDLEDLEKITACLKQGKTDEAREILGLKRRVE